MSDENTPKLRLRPKLAGTPPPPGIPARPPETKLPVTPSPVSPDTSEAAPPPPAKSMGLKPKLSVKPEPPAVSAEVPAFPPPPLEIPEPPVAPSFPEKQDVDFPPPSAKPKLSFKAPTHVPPAAAPAAGPGQAKWPPPVAEEKLPAVLHAPPPDGLAPPALPPQSWPSMLDAPPPPGLNQAAVERSSEPEPAEVTAMRKASTFPFPSPTAKFPPLPGLSANADSSVPVVADEDASRRKIMLGVALVVLLFAGGAVFAYLKFFRPAAGEVSNPPPANPSPQSTAAEKIREAVAKAEEQQLGPINEVIKAESAPVAQPPAPTSAQVSPVPTAETPVATTPPPPPPPPPASAAFKSWVINLKIRGVRGGDAQRVFIDRTSYAPGDLVNPQLGIMFAGYNEETRMIIFQDKTGATFERRH